MLWSICFQIFYSQLKLYVSGLGDILVSITSQAGGQVWFPRPHIKNWDVVSPVLKPRQPWDGRWSQADPWTLTGQLARSIWLRINQYYLLIPQRHTCSTHTNAHTCIKIKNEDQPNSLHLQNNYFLVYRKGNQLGEVHLTFKSPWLPCPVSPQSEKWPFCSLSR